MGQHGDLEQTKRELEDRIASLEAAVSERDARISVLEAKLNAVYRSTSWRVTAPLRATWELLTLLDLVLRFVAIRVGGWGDGIALFREGRELYVRGGLPSVKKHLVEEVRRYDRNNYAKWIARYDTVTDEQRAALRKRIGEFSHRPLISVVMPTSSPEPKWLIQAIESVRRQIYPHWELCIAGDASTDQAVRSILERYAAEDARIKLASREQIGDLAVAANSALECAIGEWVTFLDQNDLLSEHALLWVADAINGDPDARLIYSDEDAIDKNGRRFHPYFKCDWNVDLFYSHNLISRLAAYRADILNDVGGFRQGYDGSQDYDLALRYIERIEPKQIHHVPRVLYHRRAQCENGVEHFDNTLAAAIGERALNEHFQRQRIRARAEFVGHGYRVHYDLPDPPPLVSLIIPTRNRLELICQCVESIRQKTTYPNYEILIVDNSSDDPATLRYLNELQADERIRVLRDERPFNYSELNNAAVKSARGEVVGLLNNDVEVISPEWLAEMVSIALQPGVGAVGARLWYPNNRLQHGGVVLGIGGCAGHAHKGFPKGALGYAGRMGLISGFAAVTGACLIVRRQLYEKLGGLNEVDLRVAYNDVDFCLRLREAGYRNVWTPYAELYHHESATRGRNDTPEKKALLAQERNYMKERWGELLLNDPAYNPSLTLERADFSLSWPPRKCG